VSDNDGITSHVQQKRKAASEEVCLKATAERSQRRCRCDVIQLPLMTYHLL